MKTVTCLFLIAVIPAVTVNWDALVRKMLLSEIAIVTAIKFHALHFTTAAKGSALNLQLH